MGKIERQILIDRLEEAKKLIDESIIVIGYADFNDLDDYMMQYDEKEAPKIIKLVKIGESLLVDLNNSLVGKFMEARKIINEKNKSL